jgi:hypothetical protein
VVRDHEVALHGEDEAETLELFFLRNFVLTRDDCAVGIDAGNGERTERSNFGSGAIALLVQRIDFDAERFGIEGVEVVGVGLVEDFDV